MRITRTNTILETKDDINLTLELWDIDLNAICTGPHIQFINSSSTTFSLNNYSSYTIGGPAGSNSYAALGITFGGYGSGFVLNNPNNLGGNSGDFGKRIRH